MKFRELLEGTKSFEYQGKTGKYKIEYSIKGTKVFFNFTNKSGDDIEEYTEIKAKNPEATINNWLAQTSL